MAAPRSTRARDRFVLATGAVVLTLVLLGLAVVAERGSPREHALEPAGVEVTSRGAVSVTTEGTEAGGVCLPPEPCRSRVQVAWRLAGLPDAPAGTHYEAVLLGPDAERLGRFVRQGAEHVLEAERDGDGSELAALRLVLAAGSGVVLHEVPLDGPTGLDGSFRAAPPGSGWVRLEQIGAVSVSLLVDAEVAPAPPDAVLHAWLQDGTGDGARFVYLGPFTVGDGRAVLDVRQERVVRAEQDRFLVTLESGEVGERPGGFPFFVAHL